MGKFIKLKANKEIEIIEAEVLEEVFDDSITYSRLGLETVVGEYSFWFDDEGLLKKNPEINYNASLLGNYNCFVGDIIIAKGKLNEEGPYDGYLEDDEVSAILKSIEKLLEMYSDIKLHLPNINYEVRELTELDD